PFERALILRGLERSCRLGLQGVEPFGHGEGRLGCGLGLFRDLGQTRERLFVTNGEVGQDLPVDVDLRDFQAADEGAVGEPVETGRRVDADDPESAEIALLRSAVAMGELKAPHERLARALVQLAPSSPVSLHRGLHLAAALPFTDVGGFYSAGTFLSVA